MLILQSITSLQTEYRKNDESVKREHYSGVKNLKENV